LKHIYSSKSHNKNLKLNTITKTWYLSGCFQGFSRKKHWNARGFAREFLWSSHRYRPSKRLKRHGKSSSLHSKKFFCFGVADFLWVTS